jgi:hypothetical protein
VAEIVATIGTRQAQRSVEVFFVDASHFTNEPYVQRGWFRKGQQVKVPMPTQRQSTTLFGALHVRPQRFYWKRAARGTSTRFLEFLHQLHQCFPEALLLLILDNATMHKSRAVKRFLSHDKGEQRIRSLKLRSGRAAFRLVSEPSPKIVTISVFSHDPCCPKGRCRLNLSRRTAWSGHAVQDEIG